jgi:PAS domain S-box-containing protein
MEKTMTTKKKPAGTPKTARPKNPAEVALRESEALLRAIAENYPNSYISIIEKDLTVGYTAGQEFKKLNLDPQQFVGLTLEQVFGEHAPFVRENYLKTFGGEETQFELFINAQYQFYRTVPLMDQSGRITRILAVVENVTEHKQVEAQREAALEALHESEKKFSSAFQHAPLLMTISDVADGKYLDVNQEFQRISGFSYAEAVGKTSVELGWLLPEDRARLIGILQTAGHVASMEITLYAKDKQPVVCLYHGELIKVGEKTRLLSIAQDITERKQAESQREAALEALRLSELELKAAQSVARVGSWKWDLKTREITWSDEMYRIFGIDKNSYTGRLGDVIARVIHPDDLHIVLPSNAAAIANEPVEYRIILPDKSIRHIWAKSGEAVMDGAGNPIFLTGIAQDITERKQAEDALRESEDLFKYVFDYSIIGKSITLASGEVRANQSFSNILGYSPEEFKNHKWQDFTHPDDIALSQKEFDALFSGAKTTVRFTKRYIHKNGSVVWADVMSSLRRDHDGKPLYLITSLVDITERKQAEDALRESEARFRHMFEKNNAIMLLIEPDSGRIIDANLAAQNYYGYPVETLKRMSIQDINALSPEEVAARRQQAAHEHLNFFVFPHRLASGEIRTVEVHSSPITVNGKPILFTIVHDITERKRAEAALRESEEKYRFLVENTTDVLWQMSPDFKFTYSSPVDERQRGYKPEEVVGKSIFDFMTPESKAEVLRLAEERQQRLRSGEKVGTYTYEIEQVRKDGRRIWTEVISQPVYDEFENLKFFQGVTRDITERKRAEENLRASEQRFRTLFEMMAQGVVYQDAAGAIISANPAAEDILGLSLDQLQGRTSLDPRWHAIHEDGSDFPGETHPAMEALRSGQSVHNVIMGVFHPQDGNFTWINVNATPLFKPGESAPHQVYATFENISARKRNDDIMHARLRLIEFARMHTVKELLQETLDEAGALVFSPIGFYHFVDPDQETLTLQAWSTRTRLEFCTAAGEDSHYPLSMAGVWADCARERRPIIHNDYAALESKRGMPAGHAAVTRELVVPIIRGGQIFAIMGVGNKPDEYNVVDLGIVSALADFSWDIIQERRTSEEILQLNASLEQRVEKRTRELREAQAQLIQQEKLAVLGRVAGSMGHELRNPLGVISNAVYFLKTVQADAPDKIKEYLDTIERETRISEKIVTDLLDFVRIESVQREPVSVSDLIHQTLERFPAPDPIQVMFDLPADMPSAYADSRHIVQVLGNLVLNAYQAMPHGGKLLVLSRVEGSVISYQSSEETDPLITAKSPQGGGWVLITVKDTGIGILPENMKKIFEPLFTSRTKGIGLGLAVSKKLIEANGGRIEVQSDGVPGRGSTFTIYLPLYTSSK